MQRAVVTAVSGNRICANGRWLTAIGNKAVHPGDVVWTDGRCVYGNISEGGGAAPIINSSEPYVPLLMSDGTRTLYHKGKLSKGQKGNKHKFMASQGNSFAFADGDLLDFYLDEHGDQYALQWGQYGLRDYGTDTVDEWDGEPGIARNGVLEQPIDLKEYSQYSYDYAYEEAAAIETPLGGIGEILEIYWNYCTLANGWYESEDSYCYLLYCYAKGCHRDGINWREDGEADIAYYVEFMSYMWVMVTPLGAQPLWAMTVRDADEDVFHIERKRYRIFTGSFTLLLPDGYYIEGNKEMSNDTTPQYDWMDIFSGKLYSSQKKLICQSHFHMKDSIRLGDVKKWKWLMTMGDSLYLIKNGKREFLSYGMYNSRLHTMKNYKKWTKGVEDGTY